MAGLLDFNDPGTRMGLGLLALGQMPRNQGFQGLMGLMASQDDAARMKADTEWKQEKANRERQQWQAQDAAAQQAARVQAAIPGLFGVTTQGSVSIPEQDGVPFVSQGVKVDQPSMRTRGFDVQRALELQMTPEQIQKYYELSNLGRQEVTRTVEGMENGRPVTLQYDKYGQPVGRGVEQWKAPVQVNRGDRVDFVSPVTMQQQGTFGINMSPSERDASARGWAGNNLARQRLEFDMGGGADVGPGQAGMVRQFGKPPTGYRWKQDGTLEAIPGGPTDIKAGELGAKAEQRKAAAVGAAENVLSAVSDARKLVGINTAGVGSSLAAIPGTDARDLQSKLETIKANLGFDRLQQMREQSPTGGALGAVAVQELTALQSTVASLDQGQSRAELKKSLEKIERHYNNWLETTQGNAPNKPENTGGASGSWGDKPIPQAAINDLKMRGPRAKAQFDEVFGAGAAERVLGGR